MLTEKHIAFVGSGVMAEAMIKGLLRQRLIEAEHIMAAGPREERGRAVAEQFSIRWTTDNRKAVEERDVVVLSVKPQVIQQILPDLRGVIDSQALVLSIAAGVPIRAIADGLAHAAVVRAMPNTPGQIGEGITVWTSTGDVTAAQVKEAEAILGADRKSTRLNSSHQLISYAVFC